MRGRKAMVKYFKGKQRKGTVRGRSNFCFRSKLKYLRDLRKKSACLESTTGPDMEATQRTWRRPEAAKWCEAVLKLSPDTVVASPPPPRWRCLNTVSKSALTCVTTNTETEREIHTGVMAA